MLLTQIQELLSVVDDLGGDAGEYGQNLLNGFSNALANISNRFENADIGAMSESTIAEVLRSTVA